MFDFAAIANDIANALKVPGKTVTISNTDSAGVITERTATGVSVDRTKAGIETLEDQSVMVIEGSANPVEGELIDGQPIMRSVPIQPADIPLAWKVVLR